MIRSLIIIYLLCFSLPSLAQDGKADDLDLSFRTGLTSGTLKAEKDGKTKSFSIGGIPLGVAWHKDLSKTWGTTLQALALLDLVNSQLIRQGIDGGVAYHVLGGPRRMTNSGDNLMIISRTSSALSLGVRGGIYHFSVSDRKTGGHEASGSAFEAKVGVEYRYDLSNTSSLMAEIYTTVLSLPASVDLIQPSTMELILAWRIFI